MADFTPNYNLKKPLRTEYYNVADANGNSDIIDGQLKAVNDRVGVVEGDVVALEDGKVDKVVGKQLSDENYTLIEKNKVANLPDDTNAQLAEKVQNFKMKNEIPNGNFNNGSVGWVPSNATILSTVSNELVFIATSSTGRVAYPLNHIVNNKYYYSAQIKSTNPLVRFDVAGINIQSHSGNGQYQTLSGLWTATGSGSFPVGARDYRITGFDNISVKKVLSINLTGIFGTGNEPTKLEMDELVKIIPNQWWDGELPLTQKQFITWQLNLIRKNTNAIIALGGTIV